MPRYLVETYVPRTGDAAGSSPLTLAAGLPAIRP